MLLRRITAHVKAQNWFAVFIDFAIVVIGVFIGIQVANWNEARVEEARVNSALHVLLLEAEENLGYSHLIIYRNERLQEDRVAAMTRLRGEMPQAGDPGRGLALLSAIRDFTPRYSNYEDLRAAGDVTLLESRELRNKISNLIGVTKYNDRKRDEIIATLPDMLSVADDYIVLGGEGVEARPEAVQIDWVAAGRDRSLVNAAERAMAAQLYWAERLESYRVEAQEVCNIIAEAIERSCRPPNWVADERSKEKEAAS